MIFCLLLGCLHLALSYENEEFKHHLSTKTPYRFIENAYSVPVNYGGCVPKKIWALIRHGTRTPGENADSLMRNRLPDIRDLILENNKNCAQCSLLAAWNLHFELDNEKRLTQEGEFEMFTMGQRFRQRFPSILSDPWNNSSYVFRFTDTSRTKASAFHFVSGLFGSRNAERVSFPPPLKKDPILRFYKLCEKWRWQIKKNPQSLVELKAFLHSDLFSNMVTNVTNRFNLRQGELNNNDLQLMYTTCSFETAWDRSKISPWCSVFLPHEFEILEYAEDLEYYWTDGHGYEITTRMGCVMLNDVFRHLRSESERKAIFYFSHSGTILKFLSHLGLYRDTSKLRHDNFVTKRLWRTSYIDTFASNVAFVLFNCSGTDHVLTLHQERPVVLPGCPKNSNLCPLDHVERIYEKSRLECDFEGMCRNDGGLPLLFITFVDKLWGAYNALRKFYFA